MPHVAYRPEFWRDRAVDPVASGFGLGDGVFETLLYRDGYLHDWEAHLARLESALTYFDIPRSPVHAELRKHAERLLSVAADTTSRIRVTYVRAPGGSSVSIYTAPYEPPTSPLRLRVSPVVRAAGNPSARFKTLGYTDTLCAQRGVGEGRTALLLNPQGRVACAAYHNVYVGNGDAWVTPFVSEGALPGIVRGKLLAAGALEGRPLREGTVTLAELPNAELRVSNSLCGVLPARWEAS